MIPKVIHYCWFGRTPKPKLSLRCIRSWKKYCPDYQIVEWNEDNFDLSTVPLFVKQAFEAKKWAFVSDYVRLQVIYENGGFYFDTDVELIKNIDDLCQYSSFFAAEGHHYIATGLGFGAASGNEIVYAMMQAYQNISFTADSNGKYDGIICPKLQTDAIKTKISSIETFENIIIWNNNIFLPRDYFCPLDFTTKSLMYKTKNTYAIHWYSASWFDQVQKRKEKMDYWLYAGHRFIINTFGIEFFQKIKNFILKIFTKRK